MTLRNIIFIHEGISNICMRRQSWLDECDVISRGCAIPKHYTFWWGCVVPEHDKFGVGL